MSKILPQAVDELEAARRLAEEQRRVVVKLRRRARMAVEISLPALLLAVVAVWFGVQSNQNARTIEANANLAATRLAEAVVNANLAVTKQARC